MAPKTRVKMDVSLPGAKEIEDLYLREAESDSAVLEGEYRRPRRLRRNEGVRSMVRENEIRPENLVYPLFVHTKDENESIPSMPGCERHSIESLVKEVGEAFELGIRTVIVFPKVPEEQKSIGGEESCNPEGLVPKVIRAIKEAHPEVNVWTDIALDPYSSAGHDGVVVNGEIVNDLTLAALAAQALSHAKAGADMVAPSDMMDGRIGFIRRVLDDYGFTNVGIVAYTAKYASSFYGPFRDALDSAPNTTDSTIPKDKKTYQMDPANATEALVELDLDEDEGADFLLVKPGLPYLDIVRMLKDNSSVPIAVYHVSGEYAMLKAACANGWLDEREVVLETMLCFKRAGASAILTYYAKDIAKWLSETKR
eukprot:CAMPEP_0184679492 /NCGR_PEP_ID=MMETSP0312-20130426/2329_1 /TAXON_ID=31354 /ORGANISM="Compsopogon coeruleus, Strain SAG 36.94" /LENGTH=367 /DNA_ID=CAMNT_0027128973 /DNA_START=226 /DNA_END=1329 /DNA_ORIENTATION=+